MKFKFFLSTVLLILMSGITVMAQENPCDPDQVEGCPLDSWVYVLVITVLVFALWRWYKQQKDLKHI